MANPIAMRPRNGMPAPKNAIKNPLRCGRENWLLKFWRPPEACIRSKQGGQWSWPAIKVTQSWQMKLPHLAQETTAWLPEW